MMPHQWPVCVGEGEVPKYGNESFEDKFCSAPRVYVVQMKECPACKGECVVWEPEGCIPDYTFQPWSTTPPPHNTTVPLFENTTGGNYPTIADCAAKWSGSLS